MTWVTQCTSDRLYLLDELLDRWSGPVSLCLYSSDIGSDTAKVEKWRDRVDFHLVRDSRGLYPVNALRNIALDNARSEYVFLADVDFIPSDGSHEYLKGLATQFGPFQGGRAVIVAAAFMVYDGSEDIPRKKTELLVRMEAGEIDMVHRDPNRRAAHAATNYTAWKSATAPYAIEYVFPYEPYYMARSDIVRYDESFLGYGNDKTEHAYEVNVAKYAFWVAPGMFVLHKTHPAASWAKVEVGPSRNERLLKTLFEFFRRVEVSPHHISSFSS